MRYDRIDFNCLFAVGMLVFLVALAQLSFASQQRAITGLVIDFSTKKPISGVSVTLKGTQISVMTDQTGRFSINVGQSGSVLGFSFLGYQHQEIRVSSDFVSVSLHTVTKELDEVTVTTSRRTNTEVALLDERRKAGVIMDGISAQQIERTASITVTQALQRVVGVTVTEDKYVAIRGLGDRSVIGQLNGVRMASANPDRSAIPLDLIPASLLDNISVYKTFSPDRPADATSGIIDLKTKSIPATKVFEVVAQSGFNSNIGIGGDYNSFYNSGMGIFGSKINGKNLSSDFLNLANQYPNGLSSIQDMLYSSSFSAEGIQEAARVNNIMQSFDPVLTTQYKKAPVNQLYSVTFGNSYKGFADHKIGVILGGNYYRRTTDTYAGELTQWSVYQGVVTGNPYLYSQRNIPNYVTPNTLYLGKYQTYQENTGTEILNYGVLGGLAYRFSPRHEVSAQFLGSWGGESVGQHLNGKYEYTGLNGDVASQVYSLKQTYRNLYTYQLQGEHKFLESEYSPRLSYGGSISTSAHNDPDYRFASLAVYTPNDGRYYDGGIGEGYQEHIYALTSGYVSGYGSYGIMQADPNGRRWRHLDENNYNYKADFTLPFELFGRKQEFKIGENYLYRKRTFTENQMFLPGSNFSELQTYHLYQVDGDLDRLVSNEIIGIRPITNGVAEGNAALSGFLYNILKSPNNYDGFYETNAFYGMLDLNASEHWRITGGVRFESTDIGAVVDTAGVYLDPSLTTATADGVKVPLIMTEPNSHYKTGYKPFYSVNAIYKPNDLMNFRVAYSTTLARPELREITNVFEYDPFQMALVAGNPDLKNQTSQNLDFRWEWFTAPGEVVAVSAFGKRIHNQLVRIFTLNTEGLAATYPEFPVVRFENEANVGKVWGVEFEAVKDLGKLWDPLQHFFVGTNVLLAQSDIRKSDARYEAASTLDRNAPENSPLFEQAPYSINAWLNYANKGLGSDFTVSFNVVGERLVQINLLGEPDLYSQPVPVLDFVWSQRLTDRLIFKGYAKNILNPADKTVYANPGTGGKWYGSEYVQRSFKRGAEIMLGFTYNLF